MLAIAFSCQDLEFGGGYLPIQRAQHSTPGLTWMLRGTGDSSVVIVLTVQPSDCPELKFSERAGDEIPRREGLRRQCSGAGLLGDIWKQIKLLMSRLA